MGSISSYTAIANAFDLNNLLKRLSPNRETELHISTGEQNAQAAINFYRRIREENIVRRTISQLELDMAALPLFLVGQERLIAYKGTIRLAPLTEELPGSDKPVETARSKSWDYHMAEMIADASDKAATSDEYRLNTAGALKLIKLRLVLNMNQAIDFGLATDIA